MMVRRECKNCGERFEIPQWMARANRGIYCGTDCFHQSTRGIPKLSLRRRVLKICPVCKREFETGGRAGSKAKTLCSMECQRRSRYRHGRTCNQLTASDAAYLAGFWDADGSFFLHGPKEGSISFRVSVVGTKALVIKWVRDVTGLGTLVLAKRSNPRWAPVWRWWANGESAESLTRQLMPYLRLKRRQAEIGIAFMERIRDPALKADRQWQEEWRVEMKTLNQRFQERRGVG